MRKRAVNFFNDSSLSQSSITESSRTDLHTDSSSNNSNDEIEDIGIDLTTRTSILKHRQQQDELYKWDRLKITSHNINGLKGDQFKLHKLIEWVLDDNIHIIGLSETNLSSREGRWLNTALHTLDYTAYWSEKDTKIKGSGVAIIIHNKWAKHAEKVRTIGPYLIDITMYFKGATINIIQLYSPNNDTINNN